MFSNILQGICRDKKFWIIILSGMGLYLLVNYIYHGGLAGKTISLTAIFLLAMTANLWAYRRDVLLSMMGSVLILGGVSVLKLSRQDYIRFEYLVHNWDIAIIVTSLYFLCFYIFSFYKYKIKGIVLGTLVLVGGIIINCSSILGVFRFKRRAVIGRYYFNGLSN